MGTIGGNMPIVQLDDLGRGGSGMTPAGGDIQEIGLFIMLLPMVAMVPILGFALWQLAMARRVGKMAKARLRIGD